MELPAVPAPCLVISSDNIYSMAIFENGRWDSPLDDVQLWMYAPEPMESCPWQTTVGLAILHSREIDEAIGIIDNLIKVVGKYEGKDPDVDLAMRDAIETLQNMTQFRELIAGQVAETMFSIGSIDERTLRAFTSGEVGARAVIGKYWASVMEAADSEVDAPMMLPPGSGSIH